MRIPPYLHSNPYTDLKPPSRTKPLVVVDGKYVAAPAKPETHISGEYACIMGINEKSAAQTLANTDVSKLRILEIRCQKLPATKSPDRLTELGLEWSTKVTDLSFLEHYPNLEILSIVDFPKAHDLSPIAACRKLKALEFSGGIWNKNTAASLEPLASLDQLEFLCLANLKVGGGGIRPIQMIQSLRRLELSNQFPTEDYAFLKAKMPKAECSKFSAYISLKSAIDGKDIMIVGSRKPFLDSKKDSERIAKYEQQFSEFVAKHS